MSSFSIVKSGLLHEFARPDTSNYRARVFDRPLHGGKYQGFVQSLMSVTLSHGGKVWVNVLAFADEDLLAVIAWAHRMMDTMPRDVNLQIKEWRCQ